MIKSPLNYTGGKYRLLPQILPLFPQKIDRFIDLFCGGCNVGCNVIANEIIFNDNDARLIKLLKVLQKNSVDKTIIKIEKIIKKYKLSNVYEHGYLYYSCESSEGLASYNKEHFLKLRNDFNNRKRKDENYYYMFFTLIIFAFNNQIRFNSKNEYNLPVGKRDFNKSIRENLACFINFLNRENVEFTSYDFRKIILDPARDFIYADPPYLITCASYNEQDGWNIEDEKNLLDFLDTADSLGIKFALSNVLESKGNTNEILKEWLDKNKKKYHVFHLDYNYSNSNYHIKNKQSKYDEILVTNY